jgi:purine-cytosine permease-like protein
MKRGKFDMHDKWNNSNKWDKWGNKVVLRGIISWVLIIAAFMVPFYVVTALIPTFQALAVYIKPIMKFAVAITALLLLVPLELLIWRTVKDMLFRM